MMKHNYLINLAIGSVLVVPAVTLQSGTSDSLADALAKTVDALDTLVGVEQQIQEGTDAAVAEVVRATEPPIERADDPGAADRMLQTLREEVAALQVRLDDTHHVQDPRPMPELGTLVIDDAQVELPVSTTGLDDGLRRLLARAPRKQTPPPAVVERATPEAAEAAKQPERPESMEAEDYTADAVRLGRALYQKGRYQEALDALGKAPAEQEARYWRARCLEKLERFAEALDEFGRVAASEEGGHFVDRAKEDIEFLRWRMAFEGRTKGSK